jgi:hypothetical protein
VEHRSTVSHAFRTEGTEKKEAIMLGYRAIPIAVLGLTLMAPALARAQPNDDCTTPTPIGALPFVDLVNTAGATVGGGDPVPSCGANDNNVWYSFTAVGATSLDLRTQGSTYDTVISVYGGACGALVETGCNDDRLTGSASQVVVPLAPGESVLIAVSSSSGGGGGLVFTADVSTPAYTTPAVLLDAARSTDANPNGGTLGFLGPAVAPTRRKVVFAGRTAGLFQSVGGVVTTIAAGGDATPAGGTFAALDDPATSDAGPTAFHATMAGAAANDGIFRWDGAALTTVVAAGDGAPDGGTYRSFERHVAVNDAGSVAFLARTNVSPGLRLFVHTTAATTIVASEDDPTPCGGTFRRLGQTSLPAFDLSNAGTVAFYGEVSGGDDGIFYFDGAVLSAVACDGDATPLGGTFSRLGVQPSIAHVPAGSLRVLFQSDLNGGPSAHAVWIWDGTTTASVVKVGDVMIDGNTVDAFHERSTPSINDAGDIAVPMTATGIASVSFRPAGGNIKVVVAEGMACPFGGFFVNVPVELSLGAAGDIAFDAGCTLVSGVVVYQLGGVLVAETSRFSVTSIGMGFSFETPAISGASEVVARGTRVDVHETSCSPAAGCATPPLVLASPNALVGLGGQQIQEIFPDTLTAAGRNVAFLALTKGVQDRMAVVRSRAGVLSTVAAGGQALPGGVPGTFEDFPLVDDVTGARRRGAGADRLPRARQLPGDRCHDRRPYARRPRHPRRGGAGVTDGGRLRGVRTPRRERTAHRLQRHHGHRLVHLRRGHAAGDPAPGRRVRRRSRAARHRWHAPARGRARHPGGQPGLLRCRRLGGRGRSVPLRRGRRRAESCSLYGRRLPVRVVRHLAPAVRAQRRAAGLAERRRAGILRRGGSDALGRSAGTLARTALAARREREGGTRRRWGHVLARGVGPVGVPEGGRVRRRADRRVGGARDLLGHAPLTAASGLTRRERRR